MDKFAYHSLNLQSPAENLLDVTPSNTEDLAVYSRALNVSKTGPVRVTTTRGDVGSLYIAAGITFPARVKKVWLTGTDAGNIVALY